MPKKRTNIKKIRLNFLILTISQIVTVVFGLVVPRLILSSYGSEINDTVVKFSKEEIEEVKPGYKYLA